MSSAILTISQINEYIRSRMDNDPLLSGVAVHGEISNYKVYPSGHHYFTLKDEGAALKCVMFRSHAMRLRFHPENGMKIIAVGKVSVYPRDGAYQLYCTTLTMDGVGDLHIAFEQLKAKLAQKGLFELAHKKPLPQYPDTIGIVTSPAGAAVHDMLRIIAKRYPITKIRLLPVRVQGTEAPGEISAAIRYANLHRLADVLIVGRGGGSIEDLWAFNDEEVAWAIYESNIPVISAVGHEPDVTISDLVADVRAATPSNAAELAVPDQDALRQSLDAMLSTMLTSVMRSLRACKQRLDALQSSPAIQSPEKYITNRRNQFEHVRTGLNRAGEKIITSKRNDYIALAAKLDAMSPLKVLTRGYAMVLNDAGDIIRSVSQVKIHDAIDVTLADGRLSASIVDLREESL